MRGPLPERLAESLRPARAQIAVICGPGSGGEVMARELAAQLAPDENPPEPAREVLAAGDLYTWPGGQISDLVVRAGLGRPLPPDSSLISPHPDGASVYLVRDRSALRHLPDVTVIDLGEADPRSALFRDLLSKTVGLSPSAAAEVAEKYGNATALIPELAVHANLDKLTGAEVAELCRELPIVSRFFHEMLDNPVLLDIGRALCLCSPPGLECGYLWAELATALSGRPATVSDLTLCLVRYPGLFVTRSVRGRQVVRPASTLARTLMEGWVRPQAAEHWRLYAELRDAGIAKLVRGHEVDEAVRHHLPSQAIAADAMRDLARDGLALLSCDPATLVREIERQAKHLAEPGAKAVLLCAHRLFERRHRASYLEMSRYQVGIGEISDDIQRSLPHRPFRTVAARSQAVNTHRVLFSGTSPTLALCSVQHLRAPADAEISGLSDVYGGCSDGSLWRFNAYGSPRRIWYDPDKQAEVRGVAAFSNDEQVLVGIGTSDHAVALIDGVTGKLLWRDEDSHSDPVSVVAVAGDPAQPLLASGGVSNQIWLHRMDGSGPASRLLYAHVSEVRGLARIDTEHGQFLAFAAVDGTAGLVDLASGRLAAVSGTKAGVLNSVAVAIEGQDLVVVVGASSGRVMLLRCPVSDLSPLDQRGIERGEPVELKSVHDLTSYPAAVNCVRLVRHRGVLSAISTSSNQTWRSTVVAAMVSETVVGHVGPVWSAVAAIEEDRLYVVTAGGEGDCCAWLADLVLREQVKLSYSSSVLGGVTSVATTKDDQGRLLVVTGGGDGEVRTWMVDDLNVDVRLTRHSGRVSALLCGYRPDDPAVLQVISGSLDGPLRLTEVDGSGTPSSVVLGIAHEGVTALALMSGAEKRVLVSGGLDGTLTAWDLETRLPMGTVNACRYGAVQSLCTAGSPSEQDFVVGGQDGSVSLWNLVTLEELRRSTLRTSVLGLCPIPGRRIGWVAALADGDVAILDDLGPHAREPSYITAHAGEVRAVCCFMLAGRVMLATAGLDRRVRLFDLQTRVKLLEIAFDGSPMCATALSPFLVAGTNAGAIALRFANDLLTLTDENLAHL